MGPETQALAFRVPETGVPVTPVTVRRFTILVLKRPAVSTRFTVFIAVAAVTFALLLIVSVVADVTPSPVFWASKPLKV
jgi:hypothetical protein